MVTKHKIFFYSLITFLSGLLITSIFGSFNTPLPKPAQRIKTIVLDAGHGGKDPGAIGKLSREKEIALQVTLKLGKKIEKEIPGIKVIYTRSTDIYPSLYERPALANKNNADLFISIHLNSGGYTTKRVKNSRGKYVTQKILNTAARGTETFVLGYNSMDNQDVAIRENASILLEDNYEQNYGGFDPNDPSTYMIFQLLKRQFRDQSIKLASYMQSEFTKSGRPSRGIKEGPFAVLKTASMPAVLTEIGFISNSEEEKYMMSAQGQNEIVNNLFNAINTYRKNVER